MKQAIIVLLVVLAIIGFPVILKVLQNVIALIFLTIGWMFGQPIRFIWTGRDKVKKVYSIKWYKATRIEDKPSFSKQIRSKP